MNVSKEEVKRIADLSRLRLSDEEMERLRGNLSDILAHVKKLDELNTTDVPPTAHILGIANVQRADEVKPSLSNKDALKNGAETGEGCFLVPKVIE